MRSELFCFCFPSFISAFILELLLIVNNRLDVLYYFIPWLSGALLSSLPLGSFNGFWGYLFPFSIFCHFFFFFCLYLLCIYLLCWCLYQMYEVDRKNFCYVVRLKCNSDHLALFTFGEVNKDMHEFANNV